MDLDAEPIERTFGLVWDFYRDVFDLGAKAEADGKTKRDIMKSIYSIFDPLGFLVPIVFQAKVLMQDIWRHKYDWDEELPPDLTDRWAGLDCFHPSPALYWNAVSPRNGMT